ncbi:MAG: P-II family nitrogen regulator [Pirellulales bacterium]|nr:P-II family nitrogen regulator [Pirellulales bacterium]
MPARRAGGCRMQLIIAVIKPFLAETLLAELQRLPIVEIIIVEAKGYGRQKSYLDQYAESEYALAFLPKIELRLFVEDPHADAVTRQIVDIARTGRMGDGKIFVQKCAANPRAIEF